MNFSAEERAVLAALADVLIPAGEGFLAASAAGVAADGLDQVLQFRPDLAEGLKRLLAVARGRPPAEVVAALQREDPAAFGVLAEVVPGAYFLNPAVRTRLGYAGQTAKPIDPHPDYLEDGLLQSVLEARADLQAHAGIERGLVSLDTELQPDSQKVTKVTKARLCCLRLLL